MSDINNMYRSMPWDGVVDHQLAASSAAILAEAEGFSIGMEQGRAQGYTQGYELGHIDGWNAAAEQLNPTVDKLNADRARLFAQVQEQAAAIDSLQRQVEELDELTELVDRLQEANAKLAAQARQLVLEVESTSKAAYDERIKYNKSVLFITSIRSTLEALIEKEGVPDKSERIRRLFVEHYSREMSASLNEREFDRPLEDDEEFARLLPRTHAFLRQMLSGL